MIILKRKCEGLNKVMRARILGFDIDPIPVIKIIITLTMN